MGKYLVLWEVVQTQIPVDPKERGEGWGMLMAMIRQDIEKGITKDWGAFVGESNGYSINEGTELEVMSSLQQYVPFCTFKVLPVATESQVNDMIKALTECAIGKQTQVQKSAKNESNSYDITAFS